MLYLAPPFHTVRGVSVFRDHADALQWYYLPLMPRLTMLTDPATGERIPQLSVIKFRGGAGGGGFLNFDCNIGVEPEHLERVRNDLQSLEGLSDPPRLAPVPLIDGSVRMMLFGHETGEELPPGEEPRFVVKIDHPAKPALYGDNQAAFSVELDQEGITILEQALQGEMSPIGVVYSLDYLALRPAYSVRVHADWDRVQTHLQESFGSDLMFFSSQIDTVVDELIEARVIEIEVDTFVLEGEDTSDLTGRRDLAVADVREMVLNTFFEPSLDPMNPGEPGWQDGIHTAQSIGRLLATGGWGVPTFRVKKLDLTRIDKKTLNVNMRERAAVKRSIYPQAHLAGIFRTLAQEGLDLERFVLPVDLDDPWFQKRGVTVIPRAEFDTDSITSVNVRLQYGSEPKNVVFDKQNVARTDVEWASILADGAMRREVTASYRVNFAGVDGTERPTSLQSDEFVVTEGVLEVFPRDLYAIVPIPITVSNAFPWEDYHQVEVQTRYTDEANGIRIGESFLLDADTETEHVWKIFVLDPLHTDFEYRLIYRAVDNRDVETPWVLSNEERITVANPFPSDRTRTLMIVPLFDWSEVRRAFVDVRYQDDENDVFKEESYQFKEGADDPETFVVGLEDPSRRLVYYKVTVIFKDGRILDLPESATNDRRVLISDTMRGHRVITIRPEDRSFAPLRLKEIKANVRYADEQSALSFQDTFRFTGPGDVAFFEFDYADEQKSSYEYSLLYLMTNGMTRTTDWESTNDETLMIPVE